MRIAFLRHGPTLWNEDGRIQGRIDMPLSDAGRGKLAILAMPDDFAPGSVRCFTSPLVRARQTAAILGFHDPVVDARLSEHDWGDWEGLTREEILARDGKDAFARAGSAIDFTPKGGEPTRDLLARVAAFLREAARDGSDAVAVTHRGILRSAYTLATGWDMATPMPEKLDLSKILVLSLDGEDSPALAALNLSFTARRALSP